MGKWSRFEGENMTLFLNSYDNFIIVYRELHWRKKILMKIIYVTKIIELRQMQFVTQDSIRDAGLNS